MKRFWPTLSSGSPMFDAQHRADLDAPDLVRRLRGIEPDRDLLAAHRPGERGPVRLLGVVDQLGEVDAVAARGRAARRRGDVPGHVHGHVADLARVEREREALHPEAVAAGHELVLAGDDLEGRPERRRRVGVGDRRSPPPRSGRRRARPRAPSAWPTALNVTVALFACGDSKLGVGSNVAPLALAAPDPSPRRANAFQSSAWCAPAEPDHVGGQHRVARVDHADLAGRHQQPRVEHELRPAPVPRALRDRDVAPDARLLQPDVAGRERPVVGVDERLADVVVRRRPDLAVGVHLRPLGADAGLVAGEVVADVRVVERARVHRVVADARLVVAGDVRADGERVLAADRHERLRVEELGRLQVGPALAHRLRLVAGEVLVRAGDHAVRDEMPVLVGDDGHVVVAVHARRVERRRDRLPEEHVRHRHDARRPA